MLGKHSTSAIQQSHQQVFITLGLTLNLESSMFLLTDYETDEMRQNLQNDLHNESSNDTISVYAQYIDLV